MKKALLVILLIFSINLVLAVPTLDLQNEEIQPGETIIATLSTVGGFTKTISEVQFFEGRRQTSFEHDLKLYNGTYYLYVYANREGNFTIKIPNIIYKGADVLTQTTIEKQIEIVTKPIYYQEEINESGNITFVNKSRTEILSIKPGLIFSSVNPKIKLINSGSSSLNLTIQGNKTSLAPSEVYEVTLSPESSFSYFNISTYKTFAVPVIYLAQNGSINESSETLDLKADTKMILTNLIVGKKEIRIVRLFNFGDENLTISSINSDIPFLEIEGVRDMIARGEQNITLTFSPENPAHVEGNLNITYTQYGRVKILSIPLNLFILAEGSTPEDFTPSNETCSGLGGKVCSSKEICNGQPRFTQGGDFCCIGTCEIPKSSPSEISWGWVIGILILGGLGYGGYYFYNKSKNVSAKKPDEKIAEISNDYNKRISGGLQRT